MEKIGPEEKGVALAQVVFRASDLKDQLARADEAYLLPFMLTGAVAAAPGEDSNQEPLQQAAAPERHEHFRLSAVGWIPCAYDLLDHGALTGSHDGVEGAG